MSDEKPLHEQAYNVVRSLQQDAYRNVNLWRGPTGTHAKRSHPAVIGALLGLAFFAVHFANDMDGPLMILGVAFGGVAVGAILGVAVAKTYRFTFKTMPRAIFTAIKMAIKGIPREPPV